MLCGEGETVVMLASESVFDLAQVLGAQWTTYNNTFVRSRRGAGLRKHSQGNSRTPFVVVLANKTTNCQEKFTKQNTGTRGGCGLYKKWFSTWTWSEGFFFFFLPTADVSNAVGWLKQNSPKHYVLYRLPLSRSPRMNERMDGWMDEWLAVQVSEYCWILRSSLPPGPWYFQESGEKAWGWT